MKNQTLLDILLKVSQLEMDVETAEKAINQLFLSKEATNIFNQEIKKVDKIKKPITGYYKYPSLTKKELYERFGCDGENGNFVIKGEYNEELIKTIGYFISPHHGPVGEYQIWYCKPIHSWRLVFGRP